MAWYVAKSLNVLRDEINRGAPNRSKASDGSIGDAAHSSRTSDHNPCSCHGAVCARDITHDPGGGFDSYAFADWLRQRCQVGMENRVKYIISNRRIASGTNSWNWRTYSGANPHSQHVHVSVAHGPATFDSPATWGWAPATPEQPPFPPSTVPPTEPYTLDLVKNTLTDAKRQELYGNGDVYLVQQVAQGWFRQSGNGDLDCGKPDGDYGSRTQQAVKTMQAVCGLAQDAQCGPQTWAGIHVTTPKYTLTDAKRAQLQGNPAVFLIQQISIGHFRQLGTPAFDCGKPDGDYGPRTQEAVRELQRIAGLTPDAQCGPNTWGVYLNKAGT